MNNDWVRRDLKHNWHPYTQMKDLEQVPPIFIQEAEGVKLYDNKGNFYYDTFSSWWCNVHGHNHPKIKQAIKKQVGLLSHISFAGFTHKPAVIFSEKIVSIAPKGLNKVFYSDNGSTSIETALKMSLQYWHNSGLKGKKKFLSLDYGYHGDTIGAMSVSSIDVFQSVFKPLLFSSYKVHSPYCYRCPVGKSKDSCSIECIKQMEDILKKDSKSICAIILEPIVLAAGGMIVYPEKYLKKVFELSRKHNVHLILDEVATGFGRTGKMFACNYADITCDFLCLSKGITSGYLPLGVTLTTKNIYDIFYDDYENKKTFFHGHTYTANPVSISAAIASLKIFEKENTIENIRDTIKLFHRGLERFRSLPLVGDVRYKGLIGAFELVKDKQSKKTFDLKDRIGFKIYKQGLKNSLILRPLDSVIYLFLPLCIKNSDIEIILDRTYNILGSAKKLLSDPDSTD